MSRTRILCSLCWQILRLKFTGSASDSVASKRLLFVSFQQLGGIYIKFLQILAVKVDFLQGWAGPSELKVFEAVDYESIDLNHVIPTAMLAQFTSIDTQPFAAGSFAQVYKAHLYNQQTVVIKVLRPSLQSHLAQDLRVLKCLTWLLAWIYPQSLVDIRDVFQQFAETARLETDYIREVTNAQWFAQYFANNSAIIIPHTYAELSTTCYIVQEYIAGLSLSDVMQAKHVGNDPAAYVRSITGSDLWQQVESLGEAILTPIFVADFSFGDPHPGNIKLLPNNQIALIDFGIIATPPKNRQAFLELIKVYETIYAGAFNPGDYLVAALKFFDTELYSSLQLVNAYLYPEQPNSLTVAIRGVVEQLVANNHDNPELQALLERRAISPLFNTIVNENNRFGIKLDLSAGAMIRSSVTYLSTVGNLGGSQHDNLPAVHRAIQHAIAAAESSMPNEQPSSKPSLEAAFETIGNWLDGIASDDPLLYRQITAKIVA